MTPRDPLDLWMEERRSGRVPDGFAEGVMKAIRAAETGTRAHRGAPKPGGAPTALAFLTLAAGALVVVACHATLFGGILLALSGTAQ